MGSVICVASVNDSILLRVAIKFICTDFLEHTQSPLLADGMSKHENQLCGLDRGKCFEDFLGASETFKEKAQFSTKLRLMFPGTPFV